MNEYRECFAVDHHSPCFIFFRKISFCMNLSPYFVPSHCTFSSHVMLVFLYVFSFHSSTRVYPVFFFTVVVSFDSVIAVVVFWITNSWVLLAICCNRFMYANSDSPGCCRHGESSGTPLLLLLLLLRRAANRMVLWSERCVDDDGVVVRQFMFGDGQRLLQNTEKLVPKDNKIRPNVDDRSKVVFIVVSLVEEVSGYRYYDTLSLFCLTLLDIFGLWSASS